MAEQKKYIYPYIENEFGERTELNRTLNDEHDFDDEQKFQ